MMALQAPGPCRTPIRHSSAEPELLALTPCRTAVLARRLPQSSATGKSSVSTSGSRVCRRQKCHGYRLSSREPLLGGEQTSR